MGQPLRPWMGGVCGEVSRSVLVMCFVNTTFDVSVPRPCWHGWFGSSYRWLWWCVGCFVVGRGRWARLYGRVVPERGLRPLSTGSNRSVGCWVGNPAGAIEVSESLSFPVGVRRRTFGGLWRCRCFGETAWSVGAGIWESICIDRFQWVYGVLGGKSRAVDADASVGVVSRWCQEKGFWWFMVLSVFRRDCMVGWCRRSG